MLTKSADGFDTKLSKKLSYLLRHGALKEGLVINPDGFVAVDELLQKSLQSYTLDDIKRVVATNNKQRFTLADNNGILQIKANQGHSLREVNELSLKEIQNLEFDIVHGTYYRNWQKIKKQGLSRLTRNHIHFAKGLNFICGLRRNAEVFIYIDFQKATQDNILFFESENGVILSPGNLEGIIPPKYFKKVLSADMKPIKLPF